ncbi:MAG: AAA family ATPase [Sulfurovum sp.]|nr:AAA family ATPase [Sulfurovum sp.]
MKIQKIELENFRSFKKEPIELLPDINVFVGVNGAGKSSILDAIAISLSWLVEGIQKADSKGLEILESSIKNSTNFSSITLDLLENGKTYSWKNIEFIRGYPADKKSELDEVNALAYYYQEQYQDSNTLPMIAYYPINRIAKGMSGLDIYGRESVGQLDVYDNALGSKANFQAFFEWFRLQDDIINEQAQSQSKWMSQHKKWIKRRITNIFRIFTRNEQNETFNHFKEMLLHDEMILQEPKYLFRELIHTIEHLDFKEFDGMPVSHILHDIEYLFYKMSRSSNIEVMDNFSIQYIERILEELSYFFEKEFHARSNNNDKILQFIWEMFSFATLLGLWRLSDNGRKQIERVLRNFNPLNKRYDIKVSTNRVIENIEKIIQKDILRVQQALSTEGRELEIVTKTIEKFIPEYSNLRVTRIPTPHMLVEKNGETIRLDQLSDGEKNMIAMIGDISRRLSMANPRMENPLEGDGIVLIDEIDLHLHPLWQRVIVSKLTEVFSNCQFIISTHSPQVLSHIRAEHIFILQPEKDDVSITKPAESYGRSTDRQLEDILGVEARPLKIKEELHQLYALIQEQKLEEAKQLMSELENQIEGREAELVKANVLIKRKEILGK